MNKLVVAGIGPGAPEFMSCSALKAVKECDILIAGRRHLEQFKSLGKETYAFGSDLEALISFINNRREDEKLCVAVSGDPGFYSLLDYLLKKLGRERLEVIPGISSFQYLFCKLVKPWKDFNLVSLHGKDADLAAVLKDKQGAFFLTDRKNNPAHLAEQLLEQGLSELTMTVGENLSYEDEKITVGKPADIIKMSFSDLCVVVVEKVEGD